MAEIIEFIKPDKQSQFSLSGNKVKEYVCRHPKNTINELRRVIECKTCGQVTEPYDFILQIASKEIRLQNDAATYRAEISELKKEIEILSKKKESLKRSVRRLL